MTLPININYKRNSYGFSDPSNENNRYLFELIINGQIIGRKYFGNLEDIKYSHLIKLNHKIKLTSIENYKVSVTIIPSDNNILYELEGNINQYESSSTQRSNSLYIEFTKNDIGYAMCSCFYTGLDYNKIFASPPN